MLTTPTAASFGQISLDANSYCARCCQMQGTEFEDIIESIPKITVFVKFLSLSFGIYSQGSQI
jgi:hypothetical protein